MGNLQETLKKIMAVRIVRARTTMNYSQGDVLAELERCGIARTQGSVSQIERGKRLPSVESLYVIARYLNTSTDYLLGLTENELAADDAEEDRKMGNGDSKLEILLRHMTKEQRQQVMTFAEYLVARQADTHTPRERNIDAGMAVIESVERQYGYDVRVELERIVRGKRMAVDTST